MDCIECYKCSTSLPVTPDIIRSSSSDNHCVSGNTRYMTIEKCPSDRYKSCMKLSYTHNSTGEILCIIRAVINKKSLLIWPIFHLYKENYQHPFPLMTYMYFICCEMKTSHFLTLTYLVRSVIREHSTTCSTCVPIQTKTYLQSLFKLV